MEKALATILKFMGYFFFIIILGVIYSIKYVITGKSIISKMAILGIYAGLIASLIYNPMIFMIVAGIIVMVDILLSISMINNKGEKDNKSFDNYKSYKKSANPLFDGMSLEEAKKEYRQLMKKYHPDNINGNLEMSQKIVKAYGDYCIANENK